VKFGRPEVGEIARCLPDKNKISAISLALASAPIAPKICQSQRQTMYSECPKLHPNGFTAGGVIAERVNTVQTRHSVSNTRRSYSFFAEQILNDMCTNEIGHKMCNYADVTEI